MADIQSTKPIRVIFFGTPVFSRAALEALSKDSRYEVDLVVTQVDKPAGRGNKITPSPVKLLADELQIPVIQPRSLRKESADFLDQASSYGPFDIGVVVAFGQILPKAVLNLPKSGCVNIHASLLPRWRGAAPIQRAIMAGDRTTGICLMRMEEGLDTGPVFSKEEIPISPSDTSGTLSESLSRLGAKLLVRDLLKISNGEFKPVAQLEEGTTYATKIENDEAKIDWTKGASEIALQIRGLSPFPGAFTVTEGLRLKLFMAVARPDVPPLSPPGTVLSCEPEGITVQCGNGRILITELQLEGKKRLSAAEFNKSSALSPGVRLGEC